MVYATWLPLEPGADVWDLVPGARDALRALYASLWQAGLDGALLERCRRRAEALIAGLPAEDDAGCSEREHAALGFVEQYVIDPHGVTDGQAEALHRLFTPEELAALTTALATFDALARVRTVLGAVAGTPASIEITAT